MKVGETAADWTAAHEEVVWKFYSTCNPQTLMAGFLQGYMGDTQGRGVLQQAAILSISAVVRFKFTQIGLPSKDTRVARWSV